VAERRESVQIVDTPLLEGPGHFSLLVQALFPAG
jgi:hypothetical protein